MTFKELKEQLQHDFSDFTIEDNANANEPTPELYMINGRLITINYRPNRGKFPDTRPKSNTDHPTILVKIGSSDILMPLETNANYLFLKEIIANNHMLY